MYHESCKTQEERSLEGIKLLQSIKPQLDKLESSDREFITNYLTIQSLFKRVYVSTRQLTCLKEIASKLD